MRRLITGIGLLILAIYLVFLAPQTVFVGAALCMSLLCFREFSTLVAAHSIPPPGVSGLLAGLAVLFSPSFAGFGLPLVLVLTVLMVIASVGALRNTNLRQILPQVACAVLAAFYTFAPWRFAVDLRGRSIHLLFFALALNWAGDTAAYYAGRLFGKRKLAPNVSPGKTWEGAIASIVGAVLFGVVYLHYFAPALRWWKVAIIAVLGNIAGQLGDLVESAIKRGAGVKDSGTLLPGHGGMLDRVDSSLFALPVVYLLYLLFGYQ